MQSNDILTSTLIILTPETPNEPAQCLIHQARQEINYSLTDV